MNTRLLAGALGLLALMACEKPFPAPADPVFELYLNNELNELNGRFAVFVNDPADGKTLAFRWLSGEDTARIQIPGTTPADRFDCSILKVTTLIAPGSGVRDTFLQLTTYTQLGSGEQINLRDQVYQQGADLKFQLTGMQSLDSIVTPDAYAILRPQESNDYRGEYRCFHSGHVWFRILINGEKFWKFVRFDQINAPTIEANTLDVNLFTFIFAPPIRINLPFVAEWQYQADGLIDTAQLKFFPLSQQYLPPGSFIPDIDHLDIFEPVNNEQFDPNRPYEGFRLKISGTDAVPGGYTYLSDRLYTSLPGSLPTPAFDLLPTILADNRLIAVQCQGDFDVLAFSRSKTNGNLRINWEVFTRPTNGIVSYRLPDVPSALGDLYDPLKKYNLGGAVRARAESYERALSYEEIIRQHLRASDVLWQAKAGYLGREETF